MLILKIIFFKMILFYFNIFLSEKHFKTLSVPQF